MLALLLVAASLGLSNFGAAIALGVSGVDARTRLRVGLVFGAFEFGMPVLGLLLGEQLAGSLGHAARWVGAGLLIGVGGYAVVEAARAGHSRASEVSGRSASPAARPDAAPPGRRYAAGKGGPDTALPGRRYAAPAGSASDARAGLAPAPAGFGRLLASGLALSLDNLVVGFALGTYRTSIVVAVLVIGVASVALSLIGLELGARIGCWAGDRGEQLAGLVLISVGIMIASGALS